jgi:hypothetical protein
MTGGMNRVIAALLFVASPLALGGCPPAEPPAAQPQEVREALVLKFRDQQASAAPVAVGQSLDLDLGFGPGEDPALFGALIADPEKADLTQWHSEPDGAVDVDAITQRATFHQSGPVKLWATWHSPHGEFKSNTLELNVAEGDATPAEAPQAR